MRLDYGTQLSPCPISLSIGTIRKPTLKDIATISFEKFMLFEVFTKLSPSAYYEKISSSNSYWDSLSEDEKDETTMYKVIMNDERVRNIYIDVLNSCVVSSNVEFAGNVNEVVADKKGCECALVVVVNFIRQLRGGSFFLGVTLKAHLVGRGVGYLRRGEKRRKDKADDNDNCVKHLQRPLPFRRKSHQRALPIYPQR